MKTIKKKVIKKAVKKTTSKTTTSVPVKLYSYTDQTTGDWVMKQAKKAGLSKAAFINKVLVSAKKTKLISSWK